MAMSDVVVKGEAIESDDDYDFERGVAGVRINDNATVEYKGTVFSGEAPESDDEILAFSSVKLGTAQEVTETFKPSDVKSSQEDPANLSVLQQCLVERNRLLWTHLNECVQQTVTTASSQVLATEQQLIQSQIKVQAATQKLKQASETSDHIISELQNILTTGFLPDINIPTNI